MTSIHDAAEAFKQASHIAEQRVQNKIRESGIDDRTDLDAMRAEVFSEAYFVIRTNSRYASSSDMPNIPNVTVAQIIAELITEFVTHESETTDGLKEIDMDWLIPYIDQPYVLEKNEKEQRRQKLLLDYYNDRDNPPMLKMRLLSALTEAFILCFIRSKTRFLIPYSAVVAKCFVQQARHRYKMEGHTAMMALDRAMFQWHAIGGYMTSYIKRKKTVLSRTTRASQRIRGI